MSDAYIALTIKVTDNGDDKFATRSRAETLSNAISTLLRTGGDARVWTSVIDETEREAIVRLDDSQPREVAHVFKHALIGAITTDGYGRLYYETEAGVQITSKVIAGESAEVFADVVRGMVLEAEEETGH